MKKNQFKVLSDRERKAKLLAALVKKTNGTLSKVELEEVVNSVDIDTQYTIKVFDDAKKFASAITEHSDIMAHSWAGSRGHKEWVYNVMFVQPTRFAIWDNEHNNWLDTTKFITKEEASQYIEQNLQNIKNEKYEIFEQYDEKFTPGQNYKKEYSDNGRETEPDVRISTPQFEVDKKVACLKEIRDWDEYNNPSQEYDDYKYELLIYVPSSKPYKIDPDVEKILAIFNIA